MNDIAIIKFIITSSEDKGEKELTGPKLKIHESARHLAKILNEQVSVSLASDTAALRIFGLQQQMNNPFSHLQLTAFANFHTEVFTILLKEFNGDKDALDNHRKVPL